MHDTMYDLYFIIVYMIVEIKFGRKLVGGERTCIHPRSTVHFIHMSLSKLQKMYFADMTNPSNV